MWETFIQSFQNLTTLQWVSQICGLIGLVIIVISYQFERKNYLLVFGISMIFFVLEQMFAGLYSNAIVSVIALIRNFMMYFYLVKTDKELPNYMIFILTMALWMFELIYFTYSNGFLVWQNYIPPILVTILTILQNNKNYYIVKLGIFIQEGGFCVYYCLYHLPISAIRQALLVIAVIASVIMMLVKTHREKKQIKNENEATDSK